MPVSASSDDSIPSKDNNDNDKPLEKSEALFREFLSRRESGEDLDPEEYFSQYPELKKDLRVLFNQFKEKCLKEVDLKKIKIEKDRIIGDFKIIREIGKGAMGVVYEAEQISLKRKVALKLLPAHLRYSDQAVRKFRREAEAGGRQSHPGIVAIHAVGENEGIHYIAQELVEGSFTLADKLAELHEEGEKPSGYFRDVAHLVADLADAFQHAHDSGVIHRDIKPSNILITKEGYPKVTDFGLAKIEDVLALSRTGDFAGTPYYMSPEQAMSRRIGIDHRTDIYSLGVSLYEMLCLKRPFEGKTSHEVLKQIVLVDPTDPHKANPKVPQDLSTICLKAMEKHPDRRYQTMREYAEDLRRFLSGDVILAKPVGFGTRLWKRMKRNPVLSAAVGVALLAVAIFVIVVPWIIATMEKEKSELLEKANEEIEKQARIAEDRFELITRLSDVKRLSNLRLESNALWPAYPDKIDALKRWIERAEELLDRLDIHKEDLESLRMFALPDRSESGEDGGGARSPTEDETRNRSWEFEDLETKWWHDTLAGLVAGLEELADEDKGLLKNINDRLAFAQTVKQSSIDDYQEDWDRAIASIANQEECPQYKGLKIAEQSGFVPLGQDPDSELWEFAHLQTGTIPERGMDGKLEFTAESGLVFVLIPGGTFQMGTVRPSNDHPLGSPNVDPMSERYERPVHPVDIEAFLLSKYEMTQGQWLRFKKYNPSAYAAGELYAGKAITLLDPVEYVSWEDCTVVLKQLSLRLPTESEWEYACRGNTTTVYWTGDGKESLEGAANLFDLTSKRREDRPWRIYEDWLDDGYLLHSPVGVFLPNPFGLHDVHGNVFEWCQDAYFSNYEGAPADGTARQRDLALSYIFRGGSFLKLAARCRSAHRAHDIMSMRYMDLGLRPAYTLR